MRLGFVVFCVLLLGHASQASPVITDVSPRVGSQEGGVVLTLEGSGFRADASTQVLIGTHECRVLPFLGSPSRVVCVTPAIRDPGVAFPITVLVDGELAPCYQAWECFFSTQTWRTPTIYEVVPFSVAQGGALQVRGRFPHELDVARFKHITVGRAACNRNDAREDGLVDNDPAWLEKNVTCYDMNDVPGFFNVSVVLEGEWGAQLLRTNLLTSTHPYHHHPTQGTYMVQVFPTITSLSHHAGSVAGGLVLTIRGSALTDGTLAHTAVDIDGTPCAVLTASPTEITCVTSGAPNYPPPSPTSQCNLHRQCLPFVCAPSGTCHPCNTTLPCPFGRVCNHTTGECKAGASGEVFVGGRGAWVERFDTNGLGGGVPLGDDVTTAERLLLAWRADAMQGEANAGNMLGHVMRAVFVPWKDGNHTFYTSSDDFSALLFSELNSDEPPTMVIDFHTYTSVNQWFDFPEQASPPLPLVAGTPYLLELHAREWGGDDHMALGVRVPMSEFAPNSVREVQRLTIDVTNSIQREVQRVRVNATAGTFRLGLPHTSCVQDSACWSACNAQCGSYCGCRHACLAYWTCRDACGLQCSTCSEKMEYTTALAHTASAGTVASALRQLPQFSYFMVDVERTDLGPHGGFEWSVSLYPRAEPYSLLSLSTSSLTCAEGTFCVRTVERVQAASAPLSGSFTLAYNGVSTAPLDLTIDATCLAEAVGTLGLGAATARRRSALGNFLETSVYDIFLDEFTGDLELLSAQTSTYSGGVGTAPTLVVAETIPGSADHFFGPIPGDLVRVPETSPQVHVAVNGSPAACNGDCSFQYNDADTPTLTSLTSTPVTKALRKGTNDVSLAFVGDALVGEGPTTVVVGGAECVVESVSPTSVQCTVDLALATAGEQVVEVSVDGVGRALAVETATISVPLVLHSITPDSATAGGGAVAVIDGEGFGFDGASVSVEFGGVPATVVEAAGTQLAVVVPPGEAGATVCTVVVGGVSASLAFAFDESFSVLSVSPTTTTVHSLTRLVLSGANFGPTSALSVTVGNDHQPCHIASSTPTTIVCDVGGGPPGNHSIVVREEGVGVAGGAGVTLERVLAVTALAPSTGSALGSTLLTVSGTGFSAVASQNEVRIGDRPCDIVSASADAIVCHTRGMIGESPSQDVSVRVGQFTSDCEAPGGTQCVFVYDDARTPLVSAVEQEGVGGTRVRVHGAGFSATSRVFLLPTAFNPLESGASFGALVASAVSECVVEAWNSSEIACTTSPPPAASWPWLFVVSETEGLAASNSQLEFPLAVTGVSPAALTIGGGVIVVSGFGFGGDPSALSVAVGTNRVCTVLTANHTEFTCVAPERSGEQVVTVTLPASLDADGVPLQAQTTVAYTAGDFRIRNVVAGSDPTNPFNITVEVTNLAGALDPALVLWLELVSADGRVVARTRAFPEPGGFQYETGWIRGVFGPDVPAGIHKLRAEAVGRGYSRKHWTLSEDPTLRGVELSVEGVSPSTSSFVGGRVVEVVGAGFDAAATTASLCHAPCAIVPGTLTFSSFSCVAPPLVTTHSRTTFGVSREPSVLNGTLFSTQHYSSQGPEAAFDGDHSTYFSSASTPCFFGMDFGEGSVAAVSHARVFPRSEAIASAVGGVVEGSNDADAEEWDVLVSISSMPDPGWTDFRSASSDSDRYRFVRFRNPTEGSRCVVAELELFGAVYAANDPSECALLVTVNGQSNASHAVQYSDLATPVIEGLAPSSGTTAGGVQLVVTGSGFGSVVEGVEVWVDGVECAVSSVQDTQVVCTTGARPTFTESTLQIMIPDKGHAANPNNTLFLYVDRWSEPSTWGGNSPPVAGDSVYIPPGQHVLLDESTPPLSLLLIEGTLRFADEQDLELDCQYIFVRGGSLVVGTEDAPFQHNAVITLRAAPDTLQLPLYGSKHIAVRRGTLDLHGREFTPSWTRLSQTATTNDTTLVVADAVNWEVGQRIVVASSSFDMLEAEEFTITGVSGNRLNVTPPVTHTHYGVVEFYNGKSLDMRSEVGLLSRNVKVQGDESSESTKFGAHIMLASPGNDSTIGRISNIECFRCGQAFQLGRYPIHFHMIGSVSESYVRNNAIHHSYNRAITVHGVYHLRVLNNVGYDTLGHTFFVEDGAETHNIIDGNLGLVTRASHSLLNTDTTPATFWVTNPTNIVRNNAAAGSERYGFWYEPPLRPTGASLGRDNVCPRGMPLLEFSNNRAHSNGRYGLRIFEVLVPREFPCDPVDGILEEMSEGMTALNWDHSRNPPITAIFDGFTSYKNGRNGAIGTIIGDVRFHNFRVADNARAGIEVQEVIAPHNTAGTYHSVIVGHSGNQPDKIVSPFVAEEVGTFGFVAPRMDNYTVQHTSFHWYDRPTEEWPGESLSVFGSCSHCAFPTTRDNGARTTTFRNITLEECPNRVQWGYPFKAIFEDLDGTMVGHGNARGYVTRYLPHLHSEPECAVDPQWTDTIYGHGVLTCGENVRLRRFTLWSAQPTASFFFKDLGINNTALEGVANRTSFVPMELKDDPSEGWAVGMATGNTYEVWWVTLGDLESVTLHVQDMSPTDYFYVRFNYTEYRHHFEVRQQGQAAEIGGSFGTVPPPSASSGSIFHDPDNRTLTLLLSGRGGQGPFVLSAHVCPRDEDGGCPLPLPEDVERENFVRLWSNETQWIREGYNGVPQQGEDVIVRAEWQLELDVQPAELGLLTVLGVLRFNAALRPGLTELRASSILVRGGRIEAGTLLTPYAATARIVLTGSRSSDSIVISDDVDAGNMALAVFGTVSLVGKEHGVTWTRLAAPALAGTNTITLVEGVTWAVGDQITLASTDFDYRAYETHTITQVDGLSLTLEANLEFYHHGASAPEMVDGVPVETRGEVALVSRNVQIVGENSNAAEEWGCHVLVSRWLDNDVMREGTVTLSNVEIANCGQVDTDRAALHFVDVDGSQSIVRGVSLRNSYNRAIRATRTTNLTIRNCVVDTTVGSSIVLESASHCTVRHNLALGAHPYPAVNPEVRSPEQTQVLANFEMCGLSTCTNVLVEDNVAAGSANYGFVVFGQACGDSDHVINNLAHSMRVGAWLHHEPRITCTAFNDFTAHKCFEIGVFFMRHSRTTSVERVVVADNVVGISLSPLQPRTQDGMVVQVVDSVVVGRSEGNPGCGYDGNTGLCNEGDKVQQQEHGCADRVGIYTTTFGVRDGMLSYKFFPPPPPYLPWHKVKTDAQFSGAVLIQGVTFASFENADECGHENAALRTNPTSPDLHAVHTVQGATLVNVEASALLLFDSPKEEWWGVDNCDGEDCTGLFNVVVRDVDGSFLGAGAGAHAVANAPHSTVNPVRCALDAEWNGFLCAPEASFGLLVFESLDADTFTRRVAPVTVTSQEGYESANRLSSFMDHGWALSYTSLLRLSRFPSVVETNRHYNVTFGGTNPRDLRFGLFRSLPVGDDAVVVSIRYASPELIEVSVGGVVVETQQAFPTLTDAAGTNQWVRLRRELSFVVREGSVVTLRTRDAVQVSLTLTTTVQGFFDNDGESRFVDRIAFVLNISPQRIRVVDVVSVGGSSKQQTTEQVEVDFVILDEHEIVTPSASPSPSLPPDQSPSTSASRSLSPSTSPSANSSPSASNTRTPTRTTTPTPSPSVAVVAPAASLGELFARLNSVLQSSNASAQLGLNATVVGFHVQTSVDPEKPCTPECGGPNGTNPATCSDGQCSCNDGLEQVGGGTPLELIVCAVVPDSDACAESNGGCDEHAECEDLGTVVCTCAQGYTGDGYTCEEDTTNTDPSDPTDGDKSSNAAVIAVAVLVPVVVLGAAAAVVALRCRRPELLKVQGALELRPGRRKSGGQLEHHNTMPAEGEGPQPRVLFADPSGA